MAARPKYTEALVERLLEKLRTGCYIETACVSVGISRQALYAWLKAGAAGEAPYAAFAERVREAEAEAETKHLATIERHSAKQWQASAWILERRHPERYALRQHVVVENRVREELGHALDKLRAALTPAEYERVLRVLGTGEASEVEAPGADGAEPVH